MAETLLSRQGPLAHVWLASNYDKKLSKQQLLSTNIIASSNIISTRQIQSSTQSNAETITLRLLGQLLLGIVRIYSRKTKYLLDDINECLHKLKNSFKYASGASLGSGTSTVNLPPQKTTLTNFSRTLMQDQVTELDLFYQEDLNLDDEVAKQNSQNLLLSQVSSLNHTEESADIDHSIEIARRQSAAQEDSGMDLDFDLFDDSIEQGRDAQVAMPEADQSLLDLSKDQESTSIGDILGLGEPLETIDEQPQPELQTGPQAVQQEQVPRRRLVGITEEGLIKTTKRKLVVDNIEDTERGISNDILKSIQHLQTHGHFIRETITLQLSTNEKLQLIEELAAPISSKRRKIWNLDQELRDRCTRLNNEERRGPETPDESMSFDLDDGLDFDLSLPEVETNKDTPVLNDEEAAVENGKSTIQVAEHLRQSFFEEPTVEFDELMRRDMNDGTSVPLGATQVTSLGANVSQRREATKCFFELLVLATHNCVSLEQDTDKLGETLTIRPRDDLVSKFNI